MIPNTVSAAAIPRCIGPFTSASDFRGVSSISIMVTNWVNSPTVMSAWIASTITSDSAREVAIWVTGVVAAKATVMRCEKPRRASLRRWKRWRSYFSPANTRITWWPRAASSTTPVISAVTRWLSRFRLRRRLVVVRTMTAVSGITTMATRVSFQFRYSRVPSRPITTSTSRTQATNTDWIMSTTWRTSLTTVLMILPVDSSW